MKKTTTHFLGGILIALLGACTPISTTTAKNTTLRLPVAIHGQKQIILFSDKDENRSMPSIVLADPTEGKTSQAIRLTYEIRDGGYGGFAVRLAGQDLSDYKELAFWARHHQSHGIRVFLQIVSQDGIKKRVDLAPYLNNTQAGWQHVRVPLTGFRLAPKQLLSEAREIAVLFLGGRGITDFGEFSFQGHAAKNPSNADLAHRVLPTDHGIEGGRVISWCGHRWQVKGVAQEQTAFPGPNHWSDSTQSVWIDEENRLHLALKFYDGQWYCSEVVTQQPLGYGQYIFEIASELATIDKNIVVGLFTYLDDENEIDIEYTKWGHNRTAVYEQYTVQPYTHLGNINQEDYVPRSAIETCSFTWLEDRIIFENFSENDIRRQHPSRTWTYTGNDIPKPADEKTHINIWLFNGQWPDNMQEYELVLSRFEFVPAGNK